MRLIDANELKKCIEESTWNDILELVDEQPTAYDVEKVVEELDKYPHGFLGVDEMEDIKDIVRKGGVDHEHDWKFY